MNKGKDELGFMNTASSSSEVSSKLDYIIDISKENTMKVLFRMVSPGQVDRMNQVDCVECGKILSNSTTQHKIKVLNYPIPILCI